MLARSSMIGTDQKWRRRAPGGPGKPVFGTTARKQGVGTSASPASHVWFTVVHGALGDVSFPSPDRACVRMLKLLVTDGDAFFSDETENATHDVQPMSQEVPLQLIHTTFSHARYRLEKQVVCDSQMAVVYVRVRFVPLLDAQKLRVFAYVASYPFESGANADVIELKGTRVLTASSEGAAIALAASAPFSACSVGFSGVSDGMVQLEKHKYLKREYDEAHGGHVGLCCEIDRLACGDEWTFALAFGAEREEAAQYSLAALDRGFEAARDAYAEGWLAWHDARPAAPQNTAKFLPLSATVLKTLRDKRFPGGAIAALATPWGSSHEENQEGTYHLVWTRDLVQCTTALLALGCHAEVLETLSFLRATQEAAGHWPQNMTLAGVARWDTTQLDEVALPILLTSLAEREGLLDDAYLQKMWPMVRSAAAHIVRAGGSTRSDRWEDEHGYTPYTLGAEIAALLVAARYADKHGEIELASYLRETADAWHDSIDRWLWRAEPAVCKRYEVHGYYIRAWDVRTSENKQYRNETDAPAGISVDVLALTRFGLRRANDPRMVETLCLVDQLLHLIVDGASLWRRYTGDAYGETDEGKPFHKDEGRGRGWPLLTGERAHHELLAGRRAQASQLARAMENVASKEGFLAEQIWDGPNLPNRGLAHGAPTNSAAPLGWAHAEYVLLSRSLGDAKPFDLPRETEERYLERDTQSPFAVWRECDPRTTIEQGLVLRVELLEPGVLEVDFRERRLKLPTRDSGIGMHVVDIPETRNLAVGDHVQIRFHPANRTALWPKAIVIEITTKREVNLTPKAFAP